MIIAHHTQQEITNRFMTYTVLQGSLRRIFDTLYISQNMGELLNDIKLNLDFAKKPLLLEMPFTLVNFSSLHYGFSFGKCSPPPKRVVFPSAAITFTFALQYNFYNDKNENLQNYVDSFVPYSTKYPNYSYMWGETFENRADYYTISFLLNDVSKYKFKAIMYNNSFSIYNIVSMLTKCYIRNIYTFPYLDNMFNNYNKFWNMNFDDLVTRFTLQHLPYNKFVWVHATNLLTKCINYNVALFYFLYIHDTSTLIGKLKEDSTNLVLFGEKDSVLYHLKKSIYNYINFRENEDLILVAALYGFCNNNSDYYSKLKQIHITSNLNLSIDDAESILHKKITAQSLKIGEIYD